MATKSETRRFKAETRQLLNLMIHSIYTNKDIFLRELISNASDALDKLRLESLRDKDLQVDTSDLHIRIEVDREERTLTVRDNGIGMSRDEVISLIGTIAKSGTADLMKKIAASQQSLSADMIGQFGVGFYASFMVADKVTLTTRRAGSDQAVRWESTGDGTYTIEILDDAAQGTAVTLHLKDHDDEDQLSDFTADWKIQNVVKRYSDFIAWPIKMSVEQAGDDGEPHQELKTLNSMKALWARARDTVDDAEYREFYKHISHDWADPLETIHIKAEGTFEYEALLFVPSHAALSQLTAATRRGVQLYVKRVFIMDDCDALLPDYLRFVKGVVDAQDLSLNVSREILQQDRHIPMMRRRLVKKVLSSLRDMSSTDAERYRTFWTQFGRTVKEGIFGDYDNRELLLDICLFPSTHHEHELTSLEQYAQRMKDGQDAIYYITGESASRIENSPHLEAFREKGYEVLLLSEPVDEIWVDSVTDFKGKKLQSVAKGQVHLDAAGEGDTAAADTDMQQTFAALLSWMATMLHDDVKQVRLSSRLTTSPACIVGDDNDVTPTLAKMYRAMGQELPPVKRILELNPTHPLIVGMRSAHEQAGGDIELEETTELLYGMALLAEGGELGDPARFTRLLANRLTRSL